MRLKKAQDFQKILRTGKRAYSGSLSVMYLPAVRTSMAVCVGKKFGKAVQRNRIKRLLREAFRAECGDMRPSKILLVPKVADSYSVARFRKDLGKILRKERLVET